MTQAFIKDRIPAEDLVEPGLSPCPGCGGMLALRLVLKALGPASAAVMPSRCAIPGAERPARPAVRIPLVEAETEAVVTAAVALRAELDARGERETTVLAWAGDPVMFDSGLAALSRAAERNEDILCVCCDSQARMGRAIQGGSATPWGTWSAPGRTRGTPESPLRMHPTKDLIGILAAHRIPYAATATVAHPVDLVEKVRKARSVRGTRFLHVLAPCPPLWECPSGETVDLARMAVRNRIFPLYEVADGLRWRLTADHPGEPVAPYVMRQGRLRQLTAEQVHLIQAEVDERWEILRRRVERGV